MFLQGTFFETLFTYGGDPYVCMVYGDPYVCMYVCMVIREVFMLLKLSYFLNYSYKLISNI